MKSLLRIIKFDSRVRQPVFFHEYQSHYLTRQEFYYSCDDHRTTLYVVFDGGTQRRFSSVRIVLFCDVSWLDDKNSWDIQQVVPTDSPKDLVHRPPQNDATLPQLTVAFEVFPRSSRYYDLLPLSSVDGLSRRASKSVCILLESKHAITPDTLHVSVALKHTDYLRTPSNQLYYYTSCDHNFLDIYYTVTTRTVRVVAHDARPRITINDLPTELLVKILDANASCAWQRDLLSFAQVSRQWSQCAMPLLFARLESPKWKNHCRLIDFPMQSLDPCAFAKAFTKTPALALGVLHLDVDQHNGTWLCSDHVNRKMSPGFTSELPAILRATKNLQRLHLSQGYTSQANALFSALPKLRHLHTLSITKTTCGFFSVPSTKYWRHSISTTQLARCLARWPTLTSLTVGYLRGNISEMDRLFSRPPACTLTQLCIRTSTLSDKDLQYLTASSAKTLAQVTLDRAHGITDDGLRIFLDAISGNVTSLSIFNEPKSFLCPKEDPVLDAVVDRMRCLKALDIIGDMASNRMLRRRSEVFIKNGGSGVPVVRLSFQSAPGLVGCHKWAGWELVDRMSGATG